MINLYVAENENFTNNGDATLQPISATVHKIINGMWMLEMEIPYDAEGRYRKVDKGCMLRVSDPTVREVSDTQIWRIYNYKRNTKTLSVVAFPRSMESNFDAPISQLIISLDVTGASAASSLSAVSQKYTVESNITRTGRSEWTNTNLTKAINGTDDNSFVNVWGGEVVYDNLTIKILDGIGSDEDVHDVMYGKNINEISYEVDDSGLITRVYPLSTDGIHYYVDSKEYIDSDKIEDYPIVHCGFLTTPYKLIEDDANSITRTANKTANIKSRIRDKASQLSHSIWNMAIANGWKIDYLASIAKDIIANIQTMVTTNIAHADLVKVINSAVNEGMIWMSEQEDPEWVWEQVGTDAWKYGSSVSGRYARNEWQYIDKKWRYFGDDYLWQEPADDDTTWTWYESKTTHKLWYGTQDKYYLAGQYIYYTDPTTSEFTKFWLDGDGWYDADKKDTSDYAWHQDSEVGGAWFFGTVDDDGYRDKYISGQWVFIEGSLYWFDSNGYYYGEKKENPQFDWIQSGEAWWFGNPDHAYDSIWLKSQWAKIDRQWYRFDADGYPEDIHTQALSMFHSGMGDLTTLVEVCRAECYELLYDLMEEWTNTQFQNGLDVPTVTINVDMIDLSKTVDYADYQNLETIHLGDTVRCVDYVHQIATIERVVELTYDLLRGYNTAVTIGVANSTVGSMLSGSTGGGTASNNAINVDFIEQSLALKQAELVAGRNITLSDNLDGTMTIASDKLIRAGRNMEVIHNADGSDTLNAEGGALEYWIEENTKFYRKKMESAGGTFGWDCDADFKWVTDGVHLPFFVDDSVVGTTDTWETANSAAICYGFAYVNGILHAIAISGQQILMMHRYYSGNMRTDPFTYNGVTLYYTSGSIGYESNPIRYEDLTWQAQAAFGGPPTTGRHFPLISGEYTSVEDARDALVEQAHFYTNKVYYTGESIDNEVIWGGVKYGVGDLSSVTPLQMLFYVTRDGVVEATDYKVSGVSIEQIYQKILQAGDNIQIGADGKTISATDTTYTAGTNVQISGENVISATDTDAIADMTDVNIDDQTLANGQVLKWNATSEKWENGAGGGGSANISQLTQDEYDTLPSTKESDDVLYMVYDDKENTLDPNYKYYKYGTNDEIIVRVYHEGESDQEVLWFFNNWTATALDNTIPQELQAWKPTNTQPIYSDSYAVVDGAQTSWIGFYGGGIRSWTLDMGTGYIGNINAVVNPFPASVGQQTNGYYDPYVYLDNDLIQTASDWSKYQESSMNITWANEKINFAWNGGSAIGANIAKMIPIPANVSKIRFKITTGTSYSTSVQRFKMGVGVRTTYTTSVVLDGYNVSDWLAFKNFDVNNSEWEDELDLSEVTEDSYLYILGHGWNASVELLEAVTGAGEAPTRRIYMNGREYAEKVFANPIGESTESLSTVEINGVVYSIEGGGGGSFESEIIYQNSGGSIPSTITLDNGISNYDAIVLSGYRQQYPNYWASSIYLSDECAVGRIINIVDDTMYAWYTITDDTTLTSAGANIVIDKIYGLKFGSGSGGGGGSYSETELFVNSGTSVTDITLTDALTNYDELYFDFIRIADNRTYHVPYSYKTSIITVGSSFQCFGFSEYASFDVASATNLTRVNNSGNWYIAKIIGIKY